MDVQEVAKQKHRNIQTVQAIALSFRFRYNVVQFPGAITCIDQQGFRTCVQHIANEAGDASTITGLDYS